MRTIGAILLVIGIAWSAIAFNMQTTVSTEGRTIGSGEFTTYIEPMTVNNIGLMARRSNHLTMSGVSIISGILILIFSAFIAKKDLPSQDENQSTTDLKKCPFCAECIKQEAKICRFCQRDIPDTEISASTENINNHNIEENGPEGTCPSCKKTIFLSSKECKFCKASFDEYSSWKIETL